jgi:quercetin dioxygenase-like cupin family protein
MTMRLDDYRDLKLELDGTLGPGEQHKRRLLLDSVYAFLPKDPEAKVLMFHAGIAPLGYTNWHRHNGATFFVCMQGLFEAHFQEGTLVTAKAGEVYSEPIGKFHRGHNPHPELAYTCIGICLTSPQLEHITSVADRPW